MPRSDDGGGLRRYASPISLMPSIFACVEASVVYALDRVGSGVLLVRIITAKIGIVALGLGLGAAHASDSPLQTETLYWDSIDADGQLFGGRLSVPVAEQRHGHLAERVGSELIFGSGPSSNRIDLVIVGDGYTAAEMSLYQSQANATVQAMFSEEPFASYGGLFLAHRVDVVSNESGVDNDPNDGIDRDTAMDMAFWCSNIERLLCINVSKAIGFANAAPDREQVLAIANSTKYGGAGYSSSNLGTVSGGNGSAYWVAIHEFGHSFGDLADEYHYGDGETWTGGEPSTVNISTLNVTQMAISGTKWAAWLGLNPAPWDGPVDTYEGAAYCEFGIYRPSDNSMMRSLARPFNAPSAEALVLEMYAIVDPLDDWTPTGPVLDGTETVFVDPVDPGGHALDVQWSIDGEAIAGAVEPELDLGAISISSGNHTLEVHVVDATEWVKDEDARAALMTRDLQWHLDVAQPCPADQDGNGTVDVNDLLAIVDAWGTSGPTGDVDGDGIVGANDLLEALAGWGACP